MTRRIFRVRSVWDPAAGVYYSESDIDGLHIEAPTLEEFEAILMDVGPDLALANHLDTPEAIEAPVAEKVPAIMWERPEKRGAA